MEQGAFVSACAPVYENICVCVVCRQTCNFLSISCVLLCAFYKKKKYDIVHVPLNDT